ncbi:hypothetical protein BROUX41_004104 [Berkeleyomyces rouxiae]|uniref:uncharacterized protein n=1 Tax=Berkeleyomyces rouxiae TaxID=2035830 RepID=UPI003B7F5846
MSCPIYILDGGLGTTLEDEYHIKFTSAATPLWSSHLLVSDPATLTQCQADFAACPVDVLMTATYQASIESFGRTCTAAHPSGIPADAVPGYIDLALQTSRAAAQRAPAPHAPPAVALSLGPYGATMVPSTEYSGAYDAAGGSVELLTAWHTRRLALFLRRLRTRSAPRFWAFETVPRVDEILAVRRVLDSAAAIQAQAISEATDADRTADADFDASVEAAGVPPRTWIACVFPVVDDGAESLLPDGNTVAVAVDAMLSKAHGAARPWGVGINCTKIAQTPDLVRAFAAAVARLVAAGDLDKWPALVLYPDGTNGEVYNTRSQKWEPEGGLPLGDRESWEMQLAKVVRMAREEGQWEAILVGGCCKASSKEIRRLVGHVRQE